jgi:hypothetical protein
MKKGSEKSQAGRNIGASDCVSAIGASLGGWSDFLVNSKEPTSSLLHSSSWYLNCNHVLNYTIFCTAWKDMTDVDCDDGRLLFGRMHTVDWTLVVARSLSTGMCKWMGRPFTHSILEHLNCWTHLPLLVMWLPS